MAAMGSDTQRLEAKIDQLTTQVQELAVKVAGFISGFAADKVAIEARLARLEASPVRLLAWVSAGAGCLSVVATILSAVFSFVVWLLAHR